MNILAIESSSKILSVAVRKTKDACFEFESSDQFKCEHIVELIKQALKQAKITLSELDYIAVGLGPGSFTGLRIGIASAKALSLALGIKIIGVGSLDIIAAGVSRKEPDICVIVDAKRSNLYVLTNKLKVSILNYRQLLSKIRSKTLFVGDGILFFKDIISQEKPKFAFFAPENLWYPQASVLANIVAELIEKKRVSKKNKKIIPIYLYPKDCQVRNEKDKR
ncbi:MAG: tRNA (adenosine(37)-N6)-threonylcarbamoyltransferase complex dimerization subunit type 1 TsaB [Candidatus Omnitrophota bacterium]